MFLGNELASACRLMSLCREGTRETGGGDSVVKATDAGACSGPSRLRGGSLCLVGSMRTRQQRAAGLSKAIRSGG